MYEHHHDDHGLMSIVTTIMVPYNIVKTQVFYTHYRKYCGPHCSFFFFFFFSFLIEGRQASAKVHEAIEYLASFLSSREEISQP